MLQKYPSALRLLTVDSLMPICSAYDFCPTDASRLSVQEITSEVSTRTSAQESAANVDAVADDLRERIDTASSVDQAKAIRADIESQKALLGTALFTELKTKQ